MATSSGGYRLVFGLLAIISLCTSYRLDRPRLLFPYSPTVPVRATLHVSDPVGGCFHWKSSRDHDIEVVPLNAQNSGCSDRAEVRTTSKVAGNVSAMVYAVDEATGIRLSCDVRVDYISSIEILTTTSVIFVDANPVMMQIQARNKRGAAFSTLSSLPFEWFIDTDSSNDRPVRIVPFSESEWEGKPEIIALEAEGKKGHSVLVEGVTTGGTILTAKLADSFFSSISPHLLEVIVVANLQLLPSYTLYVPVHTLIPFQVEIIRQQTAYKVPMPSSEYLLKVEDETVGSLDVASSTVTALKKGITQVALLSYNVNGKTQGVSPPSTSIHVTDPDKIRLSVSGNNWLLEKGRRYTIHVNLIDSDDNYMFVSENARFDTVIPADFFEVHKKATNGSYFEVTTKKSGRPTITSKLSSFILKDGSEKKVKQRVTGDQVVDIVDPIQILPPILVLPFLSSGKRSEMAMKATGGSGAFEWTVQDDAVASIDRSTALVRAGVIGETRVTVVDRRNTVHSATAKVYVVDVNVVSFGLSRLESVEGNTLWLNLELFGSSSKGDRLSVYDCRQLNVAVKVDDESVVALYTKKERSLPTEGTGCVSIPFIARASGDTKVTVTVVSSSGTELSASQHVSVYPPLASSFHDPHLLISTHSSYSLDIQGGPRPWMLDSSRSFSRASISEGVKSTARIEDELAVVKCDSTTGTARVMIEVGNEPTPSNPLPAMEKMTVDMCCVTPTRVVIHPKATEDSKHSSDLPACPHHTRSLFVSSARTLHLTGYGRCSSGDGEKAIHSINSMKVKWTSEDKKLLKVEQSSLTNDEALAQPQGVPGTVGVNADCGGSLKAHLQLTLFDKAIAKPHSLVVWNDPSVKGEVRLEGGSGHYVLRTPTDSGPFTHSISNNIIKISPRQVGSSVLRVHDLCIQDSVLEIKVKVTDVQQIGIQAPDYMEVGRRVDVFLVAVDDSGLSFSDDVIVLMDLLLTSTGNSVALEKTGPNRYSMTALSVGTVSLSATGKSSRSTRDHLTSVPHSVQIFSPLLLFPKVVTLIPESVFQLEVVGGPRPTPAISFTLNDTKIASVQSNALITSSNHLGYTSVKGSIEFGEGMMSEDTVVVRVVTLHGIRIVVSSSEVEKGSRLLARVEGLDDRENPFAFGGAIHPLKISWSLNSTDVFRVISPLGNSIRESDFNRYSLWLEATEKGVAQLSVRVEEHSKGYGHFLRKGTVYTYQVELRSLSALSLTVPAVETGEVLIAPGGSLQLSTNWPSSVVKYALGKEKERVISVSPRGMVTSNGPLGTGTVEITREGRVIVASVQVVNPSSIHVRVTPLLETLQGSSLSALPLGTVLKVEVELRDSIGRRIYGSSPNSILFRPHRFDLTSIEGRENNRTITVRLVGKGETVLKIWDPSIPSLSSFVRLTCADTLAPSSPVLVSSDVICLSNPFNDDEMQWTSDDSKVIAVLDPSKGVFIVSSPGSSRVQLSLPLLSQRLHTELTVESPSSVRFSHSSPQWVTNLESSSFFFPLLIGTNSSLDEAEARKAHSIIDCPSEVYPLLSLRAPFDCSLSFSSSSQLGSASAIFHSSAIFDPQQGGYGCRVIRQSASAPPSVFESPETSLVVSASWVVDGKRLDTSFSSSFHVAFSVVEEVIQLTNYDQPSAVITIRVPSHLSSDIRAVASGDVVHLRELRSPPPEHQKTISNGASLKWIQVELNEKSESLRETIEITVESVRTGQTVKIPVKIQLVGETAKRAYRELDSKGFVDFCFIIISRYSHLIPSFLVASIVLLLALLVCRQLQSSRVQYGVASQHNSSAFLSDGPDRTLSPSLEWSNTVPDYSPQYRSTPREVLRRLSPLNKSIFSNGDASDLYRRKAGRFD